MRQRIAVILGSITIIGLILVVYFPPLTFSDSGESKYSSKIAQCENTPEEQRKSITDFVCKSGVGKGNAVDVALQVVLSLLFKEIDRDIEADIAKLQGIGTKSIPEISQNLSNNFDSTSAEGKYYKRYMTACQNVAIEEVTKHYGQALTHDQVTDYVGDNDSRCGRLAKTKLEAYKQAAWEISGFEVNTEYMKGKHDFIANTTSAYDRLNSKMTILIGQWATVKNKWYSKTKQTIGSR